MWRKLSSAVQVIAVVGAVTVLHSPAFAYVSGYHFEDVESKGHLFKLFTGGFGSFVMVFLGMGGMATLYLTRASRTRQGVPLLGVAMLTMAISLFAFRIAVKAGVLGHQYIEW